MPSGKGDTEADAMVCVCVRACVQHVCVHVCT